MAINVLQLITVSYNNILWTEIKWIRRITKIWLKLLSSSWIMLFDKYQILSTNCLQLCKEESYSTRIGLNTGEFGGIISRHSKWVDTRYLYNYITHYITDVNLAAPRVRTLLCRKRLSLHKNSSSSLYFLYSCKLLTIEQQFTMILICELWWILHHTMIEHGNFAILCIHRDLFQFNCLTWC